MIFVKKQAHASPDETKAQKRKITKQNQNIITNVQAVYFTIDKKNIRIYIFMDKSIFLKLLVRAALCRRFRRNNRRPLFWVKFSILV